jgi:hypothetical protein
MVFVPQSAFQIAVSGATGGLSTRA